jgi:hypothetical protein
MAKLERYFLVKIAATFAIKIASQAVIKAVIKNLFTKRGIRLFRRLSGAIQRGFLNSLWCGKV